MAAGAHDPLSTESLMEHVKDAPYFHVPQAFTSDEAHGHVDLPALTEEPIVTFQTDLFEPFDLQVTKFMVLEVVAATIVALFFIAFASKIKNGKLPKGRFWNALEAVLLFLRDNVARPAIGHDADKFMPYLWTVFFFVLTCNLLGMIPWLGSPTGALACTGVLALSTFVVVCRAGMQEMGAVGFLKAQVPHMDLPFPMDLMIKPMVFAIEIMGMFIKHFVLAVRLMANMVAGHIVLAVLVAFVLVIFQAGYTYASGLFWGVSTASVFGSVALSLLELFVAFLQAYIFTFLSALFIGAAVHPH